MDPEKAVLIAIRSRVSAFRRKYGLYTVPVNTFHLAGFLSGSGEYKISFEEYTGLPAGKDAKVNYNEATQIYTIQTKIIPLEWESYSPLRRINFSVAHELAHIFLGHLEVPYTDKAEVVKRAEDMEANAFAAELLAPPEALAMFCTVKEAADALLVSESCIRRRMQDTGVLPSRRTCPECGFSRIPPAAQHCRRCGRLVTDRPHALPQDAVTCAFPLPEVCPVCGERRPGAIEGRCLNCDNPMINRCVPEYDQEGHSCPPDARFCEICGSPTIFRDLPVSTIP